MISPEEYNEIICHFDTIIICLRGAARSVTAANEVLSDMSLTENRRQLLRGKLDVLDQNIRVPLPTPVDEFFRSLQKHVDTHYGLTDFLADYGITVPARVAAYSAFLGYTIPDAYISEYCVNEYGA